MEAATEYTPKPGDRVMCDPTFTLESLKAKQKPTLIVPAEIIRSNNHLSYVEILDERTVSNRRSFVFTDTYGSTAYVLNCAIIPKAEQ